MESMEYDSDSDPDIGSSNSPMQHSGWEPCQKVVHTISAFRRSPNTQTNKSQGTSQVSMATSDETLAQLSSTGFKTPRSQWNTCKNVFSAVSSFSGFRSVRDTLSPQEGDVSLDVSDGEDSGRLNKKTPLFKGLPKDYNFSTEPKSSENVTQSVSSNFGGMITWTSAENSEKSKLQPEENINSEMKFGVIGSLPGRRKLSKRNSMPADSPSRPSPKRLSLGQSLESNRPTSLPPAKKTDQNSYNSSVRSLCKPAPAKKRKIVPEVPPNVSTDFMATKSKLFTFKSFIVLNVILSICLSVYALNVFKSRCASLSNFDAEELTKELNSEVYGQHIATEFIPNLLNKYLTKIHKGVSQKPLVISLHGWTGVGKNYVSKILTDFFPHTTINKLLVPLHFAHEASDEIYAQQIPEWIETNITRCHVNFVIMDEMDKASDGVIRGLNDSVNNIIRLNATNTPVVFLLLSNSKGADINRFVFQLASSGRPRETITHAEIQHVFETDKALWYTKLIPSQTIDAFVPFLPLEKGHIVQCIKKDLVLKGLDVQKGVVTEVVREMSFLKLNSGKEFSQTGCKRVSDKVNLVYNMFNNDS